MRGLCAKACGMKEVECRIVRRDEVREVFGSDGDAAIVECVPKPTIFFNGEALDELWPKNTVEVKRLVARAFWLLVQHLDGGLDFLVITAKPVIKIRERGFVAYMAEPTLEELAREREEFAELMLKFEEGKVEEVTRMDVLERAVIRAWITEFSLEEYVGPEEPEASMYRVVLEFLEPEILL